ncbi:MAG TPA: hypothetical protein VHO24_11410 [Opitutaceae bacterium]|nr:hypothetical protein [Opitutaceae bacterium]
MSKKELNEILDQIDGALLVFRTHEGALTAMEISLKSMLTVVRAQVVDQIAGALAGGVSE